MERICELRHKDGLPALAVQWGAVGDVGLLEELQKEQNEIAIGGTLQQKVGNCLQVFDQLIQQKQPVVSSIVVAEKFNKDAADTPIEAVTRILGIQDIKSAGLHTTFPELGMDSMMAVEIRQTMEREFDISLGPNDLRNLTFAKLEDMNAGYGKDKPKVAALHIEMLKMLIPGVIFATSMETIIDFNIKAANCQGDFVLVFPGADADIRAFEQMAGLLHKHIKCVNYDGITRNQENVNVIVDYVFNTLHEDILQKKSFKILAYSIGYLAGIKIVKRIESLGTTGTFIIIDSGPELLYHIYAVIRGKSKEEFHFNIIEALVSTILPNESKLGLKEIMVKGKDLSERVDLMLNHYTDSSVEVKNKLKSLTFSFVSRLRSIESYKKRPIPKEKIKSNVLLYKPSDCIAKGITEDYNLNTICNLCRIDTFDGNHMTILHNEKMLQQLLIDFN